MMPTRRDEILAGGSLYWVIKGQLSCRQAILGLDAVRDTQPELMLFGHVHNPLARRVRIGRTECVNVGHFRGTEAPYVLAW